MISFPSFFPMPAGCLCIKQVSSSDELLTTPFQSGINALCWSRTLEGDFGEVVAHLNAAMGITTLEEEALLALPLSDAGRQAVEVMLTASTEATPALQTLLQASASNALSHAALL